MFGQSVSDHAMQGLAKLQEIVTEQGNLLLASGVDRCPVCAVLLVHSIRLTHNLASILSSF